MKHTAFLLAACLPLLSCTQSTPSMMNTNRVQVVPETTMEERPLAQVNEGYLYHVAENYGRYGSGTMHLSLAHDPAAYSSGDALRKLAEYKSKLKSLGVSSITAETVRGSGEASLLVSYDGLIARAPENCGVMPALADRQSTRFIGDYKFGCSTETYLAKQIYRPSDLLGSGASDPGDGRRAANNVEYYRRVEQDEAEGELDRIERGDIEAQ